MMEEQKTSEFKTEFRDFVHKVAPSMMPPPEVREHFQNARIEFWKGLRAIVDHRISRLSRRGQRGTTVAVD